MNNRIFLIFLLVTPLIVIIGSTLAFNLGYSPENTKNNGAFFNSYFEVNPNTLIDENGSAIKFEDGKWVLGIYYNNDLNFENPLYVMRQLNVALNRDIFKLKRIFVQSKSTQPNSQLLEDFPRIEIFNDENDEFLDQVLKNTTDYFSTPRIFVIDPYGRAVMFFDASMDPKLILKDLKVLI